MRPARLALNLLAELATGIRRRHCAHQWTDRTDPISCALCGLPAPNGGR